MSVELLLTLAGTIISAMAGTIVFLYRLVLKLQQQLLEQSEQRRLDAEATRDKITDMASTWSQTARELYKKIATVQKTRGKQ